MTVTPRAPRTGADNHRWYHPYAPGGGPFAVELTAAIDGWEHTSLRVAVLEPGGSVALECAGEEVVVVPLVGGVEVEVQRGGAVQSVSLPGRASVFAGPTDTLYVPAGSSLILHASTDARVAICGAAVTDPSGGEREPAVVTAEQTPVELRGAGVCSREVRGFGMPDTLPQAEQILVCEVLTPAGGWSSYPPHKHDTDRPGQESELEEIYYFETQSVGDSRAGLSPTVRGEGSTEHDPVGYQQVYASDEQRPIDVLVEVTTGDSVLVPHGWHGPAMAAPDADLYYLNVMAGPGAERIWLICDDPAHGAIRETWDRRDLDPRLPFGGSR